MECSKTHCQFNEVQFEISKATYLMLMTVLLLLKSGHFELMYYDNLHYDVVMSAVTDNVCTDQPILTGTESTIIDLTS